jgi:hypothetical protein
MESYSCKMIGTEKQLYKKFANGRDPQGVEALSPPTRGYGGYAFSTSPYSRSRSSGSEDEGVGVLCDTISRYSRAFSNVFLTFFTIYNCTNY